VDAPSGQRLRSAAVLVPVAGAFLLLPPFLPLFAAPVRVFGLPLIVLYIFGVWALLVLLTWAITRRLPPDADPPA
jgi:hypothetical protein